MKSSYTAPKLTVHGDVAQITQILGDTTRQDFVFLNGTPISGGNDIGSKDICSGTTPKGPDCDPRF
ncbi:lasso peptide [Brasilonema bromeliae]|uniref:RiPP n=1 Tax=Brasilonema bromeliae SPC951 TaxID=385972 RepID=A0ABX1P6V2_9CYAN|nr:lasso peptide [Brasilonema bromeliae]NMG20014.1 putative RiPP precursor [Brasilonema bromeliae SPC951]